MDHIGAFINCGDEAQLQAMWTEMFLDEKLALTLAATDNREVVAQFLKKAVGVPPIWTPTKCAVRIENLTEATMSAESSLEYSAAYIYSLALLCELDPGVMKLSDKQVEVAFKLLKYWKASGKRAAAAGGHDGAGSAGKGGSGSGMETDAGDAERATGPEDTKKDKDEGEPAPMEWEEQLEPL